MNAPILFRGIDAGVGLISDLRGLALDETQAGKPVATAVRLFPDATLHHPAREKPMVFDAAFRAGLIASFQAAGLAVPLDFNHASGGLFSEPTYDAGKAPGWITELEDRGADGLWGKVAWNDAGLRAVRSREYLYLSPEFAMQQPDKKTGSTLARPRLYAVALTNRPFLENQTAIAASEATKGSQAMADENETPSPEDQAADIATLKSEVAALRTDVDALKARAAKDEAEDEPEQAGEGEDGKKAPKGAAAAMSDVARAAFAEMRKAKTAELIGAAIKDGRVTPGLLPSVNTFAASVAHDAKKVEALLAELPAQTRTTQLGHGKSNPAEARTSEEDAVVFDALGLSEEDVKAFGDVEAVRPDGRLKRSKTKR